MFNLRILTALAVVSLAGCGGTSNDAQDQALPGADPAETSYTLADPIEDVSFALARRFSGRIVIPLGRSRDQVTATLERAAREIAASSDADAVMVLGYRPSDETEGIYTVGRAVFAPNGRWEDASLDSPKQLIVDLSELYFTPPDTTGLPGDTVVLEDAILDYVVLSREYGSWGEGDIVARIPPGTRAVILQRRSEPMGDQEFVRYQVRTLGKSARHVGWVHKGDTHPLLRNNAEPGAKDG